MNSPDTVKPSNPLSLIRATRKASEEQEKSLSQAPVETLGKRGLVPRDKWMFVPEPAHRSFQAQGESGTLLGPMGSPQLQAWGRNVLCPSAWEGRRGREKLPGSWEWGKDQVIVGKVGLIGEPVGSPLPPPEEATALELEGKGCFQPQAQLSQHV